MSAAAVEFFVLLTVEKPAGTGAWMQATLTRTAMARPGATRAELYTWIVAQLPAELHGATVLHFSAEPNALPGVAGEVV